MPPSTFQPGSLGALLQSGGDWTAGLSATADGVTLTVEGAFWERRSAR